MAISLSDVAVPKAYAPGTPPSTHAHTHCPAHLLPALPTCPLSHSCYTPGPDALLEPAAPMRNLTSYYLVLSSTSPLLLRLTCSLHSLALLASCSAVRLLYFTQSLSPHNGFSIHLSPWTAKIALAVVAGGTRHRRLDNVQTSWILLCSKGITQFTCNNSKQFKALKKPTIFFTSYKSMLSDNNSEQVQSKVYNIGAWEERKSWTLNGFWWSTCF